MRLAISGQLLGSTEPLEHILDLFHSLGVDAIEVWPANLRTRSGASELPEQVGRYEHKDVEGTRRLLDEAGVTAACVTLGFRVLARCARDGPAWGIDALKGAVDAASGLGARVVNCYLAGLPAATFVEVARPAAEYAGRQGVTIVLENEAHDDSGTVSGMRAIVDAVGSPHFGTLFDPCNYYQAGEEPYPYAYEVLKQHIHYVHLKGGCLYRPDSIRHAHRGGTLRSSTTQHIGYVAIIDGAVNVDGVIQRLASDGYRGFVTLEPHVSATDAADYYQADVSYIKARLACATGSVAPAPSSLSPGRREA